MSRVEYFLEKIRFELNKGNIFETLYEFLEGVVIAWLKNTFAKNKMFLFKNRSWHYFYHRRNRTWENERAVEIPIIWDVVRRHQGKRVLEVGNVLSRYFKIQHDVIDKYEKKPWVQNIDVVDYRPEKQYDLIVSISTLEHVGFDEQPREPEKIVRVFKNLTTMLNPGGEIHATFPVGYNHYLDQCIQDRKLDFSKTYFYKRQSLDNDWEETRWEDVKQVDYYKGKTWHANGLVYAVIKK